jgi:hypothetical protein
MHVLVARTCCQKKIYVDVSISRVKLLLRNFEVVTKSEGRSFESVATHYTVIMHKNTVFVWTTCLPSFGLTYVSNTGLGPSSDPHRRVEPIVGLSSTQHVA